MQTGLPVEIEKSVLLKPPVCGSTANDTMLSLSSLSANRKR